MKKLLLILLIATNASGTILQAMDAENADLRNQLRELGAERRRRYLEAHPDIATHEDDAPVVVEPPVVGDGDAQVVGEEEHVGDAIEDNRDVLPGDGDAQLEPEYVRPPIPAVVDRLVGNGNRDFVAGIMLARQQINRLQGEARAELIAQFAVQTQQDIEQNQFPREHIDLARDLFRGIPEMELVLRGADVPGEDVAPIVIEDDAPVERRERQERHVRFRDTEEVHEFDRNAPVGGAGNGNAGGVGNGNAPVVGGDAGDGDTPIDQAHLRALGEERRRRFQQTHPDADGNGNKEKGAIAWMSNNKGKVTISAVAMVATGLVIYNRDKISEVGQQAITWMKENKTLSISILTGIILGSYSIYLYKNWDSNNESPFTAANYKLWNDTGDKAWNFVTTNKLYLGVTLGGMAVAGTAGYMFSKTAATAMYDEITDQHDDEITGQDEVTRQLHDEIPSHPEEDTLFG